MSHHLETFFPKIVHSGYTITSPQDACYNCFAFAAGDHNNWWSPDRRHLTPSMGGGFWFDDVPPERSLNAFVEAYRKFGFEPCGDGGVEAGFEKIAIYVDEDNEPTHAAKQTPNGRWMSKAGVYEDFAHELHALEGHDGYGKVVAFLKRAYGAT